MINESVLIVEHLRLVYFNQTAEMGLQQRSISKLRPLRFDLSYLMDASDTTVLFKSASCV
jgi:hypothetical protein